jgi:hypothetical protein
MISLALRVCLGPRDPILAGAWGLETGHFDILWALCDPYFTRLDAFTLKRTHNAENTSYDTYAPSGCPVFYGEFALRWCNVP